MPPWPGSSSLLRLRTHGQYCGIPLTTCQTPLCLLRQLHKRKQVLDTSSWTWLYLGKQAEVTVSVRPTGGYFAHFMSIALSRAGVNNLQTSHRIKEIWKAKARRVCQSIRLCVWICRPWFSTLGSHMFSEPLKATGRRSRYGHQVEQFDFLLPGWYRF
jgi:hypothetical protein